MVFIKNNLNFILICILIILIIFLFYRNRIWPNAKSFADMQGDSYIQLGILIILFFTFLVLLGNIVFLRDQLRKQQNQIELTQTLNRPICGVTKVNLFGNPGTDKKEKDKPERVIKTDIDQRIDPSEYYIEIVMLNSGKYPAQKVLFEYELTIWSTGQKVIEYRRGEKPRYNVFLPGQEIETGFYYNRKQCDQVLNKDALRLKITIKYETKYEEYKTDKVEKYTCEYQIGLPKTITNMIHINLINSKLEEVKKP